MKKSFNVDIIKACACCGGDSFNYSSVLWEELIEQWELSLEEIDYVNRQQGLVCNQCGNNLRSIALAKAILATQNYRGSFIKFSRSIRRRFLNVLEINTAGTLTRNLATFPKRILRNYPDIDMENLQYSDNVFDLVIHSDTLEHVPDPVKALSECRRVLRPDGYCCFTIPIILDRTTKSRSGLSESYHGGEKFKEDDYLVQTEYGGNFWAQVFEAGFEECRIISAEFPSAQAIIAKKTI